MARLTWVLAVVGLMTSAGGDLVVAQPAGDQGHDLALAVGELLERVGDLAVGWPGHVLADQPAGDRRRQESVPPGGDPDRVQQVGRLDVLDEEPAGAGAQRVEDMLVEAVVGEDDHVHPRQAALPRCAAWPRCHPGSASGRP